MTDQEPIESSITPLLSVVTFAGRIFARAMSRISIEVPSTRSRWRVR